MTPGMTGRIFAALGLCGAVLAGSAACAAPPPRGAGYVAMGSSFAAGPGIGASADTPATSCARSADNYAHQLARSRGLVLHDVSCSGATTADVLAGKPGREAQIAAVDQEARLVTVTIGGNDLGYLAALYAASCPRAGPAFGGPAARCPPPPPAPADEAYRQLEDQLVRIATETRRRAPAARLVFVQYFDVLPAAGVCDATPMSPADADRLRQIARRLAEATSRAAARTWAAVLALDRLSQGHDACSAEPWINGDPSRRPGDGVAYHPNLAGMTFTAKALDAMLGQAPAPRIIHPTLR